MAQKSTQLPVVVLLVASLLALWAVLGLASAVDRVIGTHVVGATQYLGHNLNWDEQVAEGQHLQLVRDQRMLPGYERILVMTAGETIGYLPEFEAGAEVRAAMEAGRTVRAELIKIDPLDPARGLQARIEIRG